jgi:hypothetical protein
MKKSKRVLPVLWCLEIELMRSLETLEQAGLLGW